MWADRRERNFMNGLLATLAGSWTLLAVTSRLLGVTPNVPWLPGIGLSLVAVPAGFGLWFLGELLERLVPRASVVAVVAIACSTALLLFWSVGVVTLYIVVGLWALLIARLALAKDEFAMKFGWGLLAMTLWAGQVPHENYVALKLSGGHFHDATFREMDFFIFRHLFGLADYVGAFPLVRNPHVVRMLENGYLTMVFQPIVAILCTYRERYGMAQLFISGPLCYLVAGVVFANYPVFGPTSLYSDTLDASLRGSMTWQVVTALRNEMQAVLNGSAGVTGGAYFIGLPSMHVALAGICQYAVRKTRPVFWILLPLNVALISSTVLLGFHYIADAVAGLVLGLGVSVVVARWLDKTRQLPVSDETRTSWTDPASATLQSLG